VEVCHDQTLHPIAGEIEEFVASLLREELNRQMEHWPKDKSQVK
jgi:hypothetical protein